MIKVSVLCVSNRPAWHDFARWNYDKQEPSGEREFILDDQGGPRAAARARALERATGSHVAWFDDDDWQHPGRLAWSVIMGWDRIVGSRHSYFYRFDKGTCCPVYNPSLIFNSLLVPIELARSVPASFEGSKWAAELRRLHPGAIATSSWPAYKDPLLFFWLVHGENATNSKARCDGAREPLMRLVPDWSETMAELGKMAAL